MPAQPPQQGRELCLGGGGAAGRERAPLDTGLAAQAEEGLQRSRRPYIALQPKPSVEERVLIASVHPRHRVDVPVEHQRADPVREQVRVGGAEEGAVGKPKKVQLWLAHSLTQQLEVPRRVGRGHVLQKLTVALCAEFSEAGVPADPGVSLGPAHREACGEVRKKAQPLLRGIEALDRGALTDPARVPADEVKARAQRLGKEIEPGRKRSSP
jgi:hypothetical protein